MDLTKIFLISTSIFATIASIYLLILGIQCIVLLTRANKIAKKIDDLAVTVKNTVVESGDSVKAVSASIEQFIKSLFTAEAIKKTVVELIKVFRNKEGEDHEKRK